MNTIEGLKLLPEVINKLLDERDIVNEKIYQCYKPFRDIIEEVFIKPKRGFVYIDDLDIGISGQSVCFCIRYSSDDECEGTYNFPIETFVSADSLRAHIQALKDKEEDERKAKEEMSLKKLEDAEKEMYFKLKKKFEGT